LVQRYLQDHGEYPRRIVLDLWGSATMRTGGDDLAQALALLGVRPVWDNGSNRVSGFEILPQAKLDRPRVDVTLRISGLFRDVFVQQIALFDEVVRAVAALDETAEWNPLAAAAQASGERPLRIFGAAPSAYGAGITDRIARGAWETRADLGRDYLAASGHAYGAGIEGEAEPEAFAQRVASADAHVHGQDHREIDILDDVTFAAHQGGFAAALEALGAKAALYHADLTNPQAPKLRSLSEEVGRLVHGRAASRRWIDGMMVHGYAGAAEMANAMDSLFAFSATAGIVTNAAFDRMHEAYVEDEEVAAFLASANPAAGRAIRARLAEAIRRGLWQPRRNSASRLLDEAGRAA
jgi:cobaltochelatase CobN